MSNNATSEGLHEKKSGMSCFCNFTVFHVQILISMKPLWFNREGKKLRKETKTEQKQKGTGRVWSVLLVHCDVLYGACKLNDGYWMLFGSLLQYCDIWALFIPLSLIHI